MKPKPLKKAVLRVIVHTLVVSGVVAFAAMCVTVYAQQTRIHQRTEQSLVQSLTNQVMTLLPAFLLPEQRPSIHLLLSQMRASEQLDSIKLLPPETASVEGFHECQVSSETYKHCVSDDGHMMAIVVPISESGTVYGYLIKGKRVPSAFMEGYAAWMIVVVLGFLGTIFLVQLLFFTHFIRKHIGKSLESLRRRTHKTVVDGDADRHELFPLKEFEDLGNDIVVLINRNRSMQSQAERAKVAQQIAHDIRNPLSSMQTVLRYFEDLKVDEKHYSRYVNLLALSSCRLDSLAEELLEANHSSQSTIFSLHNTLDELVGEYESREDHRDVKYIKRYHTQAIDLYGDSKKLQRAFGNILKNATEAMEYAGTITIVTTVMKDTAAIYIQDTGPGMTKDKMARVLKGGFTDGKTNGHGIGMTVVTDTVEEFGGRLAGESEVGCGTRFELILPLPDDQMLSNAPREEAAVGTIVVPVFVDAAVLVIDDEPSIRQQWQLLLAQEGQTAQLYDSFEAISHDYVLQQTISTAIVDHRFSTDEYNGFDIIALLRNHGVQHIILCTAEYWKPSVKNIANKMGVVICPKPLPRIRVKHIDARKHTNRDQSRKDQSSTVSEERPRVIVLDDDQAIWLAWELEKERLGIKELMTFPSMEVCESENIDYAAIDIAFVDKNIPDSEWSLSATIRHLKRHGVRNVLIATGEAVDVVKKDPAFDAADGIVSPKIPEQLEPLPAFEEKAGNLRKVQ